jgi:hypothetical protein
LFQLIKLIMLHVINQVLKVSIHYQELTNSATVMIKRMLAKTSLLEPSSTGEVLLQKKQR